MRFRPHTSAHSWGVRLPSMTEAALARARSNTAGLPRGARGAGGVLAHQNQRVAEETHPVAADGGVAPDAAQPRDLASALVGVDRRGVELVDRRVDLADE